MIVTAYYFARLYIQQLSKELLLSHWASGCNEVRLEVESVSDITAGCSELNKML